MERKENLFVDVMILYVENTEESTNKTEKLLEQLVQQGHKIQDPYTNINFTLEQHRV